jgi:hypothetical protein
VRNISFSPSGNMIAAIIDFYSSNLPSEAHPAELIVWCSAVSLAEEAVDNKLSWTCLGSVHLHTGEANRSLAGQAKVGWTHDDSLVLSVPVFSTEDRSSQNPLSSTYGCLLSVTHWFEKSVTAKSGDNMTYVATRSKADGGIDMPGLLIKLPMFHDIPVGMHILSWDESKLLVGSSVTQDTKSAEYVTAFRIALWAGKRVSVFHCTCPSASCDNRLKQDPAVELIWSDVSILYSVTYSSNFNSPAEYGKSRTNTLHIASVAKGFNS